jgi:hypothetical protein
MPKSAPETTAAVKIGTEITAAHFRDLRAIYGSGPQPTRAVFRRDNLTAVLAVAAERGWAACMEHLRKTRKRKVDPLAHPMISRRRDDSPLY